MTNQQHPITPPPELIAKWANSMCGYYGAANWGADMELEACRLWVSENHSIYDARDLRLARRPKPPSLKEQALDQLRRVNAILQFQTDGGETSVIRRALEALPE